MSTEGSTKGSLPNATSMNNKCALLDLQQVVTVDWTFWVPGSRDTEPYLVVVHAMVRGSLTYGLSMYIDSR